MISRWLIEEPVYYCGFNSPKSYGGNSYFVRHPDGNWLIDSPKFLPRLVRRFEALGGIAHLFLTHRDDVADARPYAQHFGSRRFIHRAELSAQPDAEDVLDGEEPISLAPDFLAIPTPGHTRGHCVLLFARTLPVHRRPPRLGPPRAAAGRHRATTAGTPGRGRPSPWPGWRTSPLSGCCPATASGSAYPQRDAAADGGPGEANERVKPASGPRLRRGSSSGRAASERRATRLFLGEPPRRGGPRSAGGRRQRHP